MKIKNLVFVMAIVLGYGLGVSAQEEQQQAEQCSCQACDELDVQFTPSEVDELKAIIEDYRQNVQQEANGEEMMQKLMLQLEKFFVQHVQIEEKQVQALAGFKLAAIIAASAFAAWVALKVVDAGVFYSLFYDRAKDVRFVNNTLRPSGETTTAPTAH